MAYKRKRSTRKPARRVRRRMAMPRRRISTMSTNVHKYTRMFSGAGGIASALNIDGQSTYAPYLNALGVRLSSVVNASDFGNLYDQYRITKAKVKFYLQVDPSAQAAATASYPKMYWYRDYDDLTVPGSLNEFRENTKCKVAILRPDRPITWVWKPNTLSLIYQSAIANQFKPVWNQWLNMATQNTDHYGFKFAIDDLTNVNYKVRTEVQLWFECRQPR